MPLEINASENASVETIVKWMCEEHKYRPFIGYYTHGFNWLSYIAHCVCLCENIENDWLSFLWFSSCGSVCACVLSVFFRYSSHTLNALESMPGNCAMQRFIVATHTIVNISLYGVAVLVILPIRLFVFKWWKEKTVSTTRRKQIRTKMKPKHFCAVLREQSSVSCFRLLLLWMWWCRFAICSVVNEI